MAKWIRLEILFIYGSIDNDKWIFFPLRPPNADIDADRCKSPKLIPYSNFIRPFFRALISFFAVHIS